MLYGWYYLLFLHWLLLRIWWACGQYMLFHPVSLLTQAIFVLTYDLSNNGLPTHSNLYRYV